MTQPADTSSPGRRRRFWRNERGATAIEFGFVAIPFFALLCATIEVGIAYFADNTLDTATNEAARLIRTGQAQQQGFDVAAFKAQVCGGLEPLFDCSKLKIDVRTSSSFAAMQIPPQMNADGSLDDSAFAYDAGHGKDIVVVRAYYQWPALLNILSSNASAKKLLLSSVVAFRNEPFTW